MSDIASNRWEAESTKPPIFTAAGVTQIAAIASFALLFCYILIGSVMGLFGSTKATMADKYGDMGVEGKQAGDAPPPAPAAE